MKARRSSLTVQQKTHLSLPVTPHSTATALTNCQWTLVNLFTRAFPLETRSPSQFLRKSPAGDEVGWLPGEAGKLIKDQFKSVTKAKGKITFLPRLATSRLRKRDRPVGRSPGERKRSSKSRPNQQKPICETGNELWESLISSSRALDIHSPV